MTKRMFRTQFDKRPVKGGVFPCDEVRDGDGQDPRYDRDEPRTVANRKALQLCGQVRDLLNGLFGGLADPVLQGCYAEAVLPAPDSTQLLAVVRGDGDPDVVHEHLRAAAGLLRTQVGAGINRKRVPQIRYEVRP